MNKSKIAKVFHAASQDIEIFYNIFAVMPENLFDTQIAAKLLGFGESISYGKLVEHYCDKVLDKSQRFTDWMKRPLDPEQVEYALNDVIYLRDIYKSIKHDLQKKKRLGWAEEEMDKLLEEELYEVDPNECWRKMKIRSFNKEYLALVKSLCRWREHTAQNQNKPRNWVLRDDAIQEIAALKPKKSADFKGLRFFRYDAKLVGELIGIIDYGLREEEAPYVKKKKKANEKTQAMVNLLKIILKSQAANNDIAMSVIADGDDIISIAEGEMAETRCSKGWRYEVFGKYAEKLFEGKLAITVDEGELIMIEPEYA
jgi:ribonuclease D